MLTQNPANRCDGEDGEPLAQRHTSPPYSAEIRAGAGSRRRCRTAAHRVQAHPNIVVSPGAWHGFRRGDFHNRGGPDVAFRGLVQADQLARSKSPSSTRGSLAPAASPIILRIATYIARSNRE